MYLGEEVEGHGRGRASAAVKLGNSLVRPPRHQNNFLRLLEGEQLKGAGAILWLIADLCDLKARPTRLRRCCSVIQCLGMKSTTTIAATFFLLCGGLHAQLAAPNDLGVAMGHLHLNTADVAAQKKFWVDALGAKPVKLGAIEGVSIPGAIVLFTAKAPTGPTEGSTVNHVGVLVPSLDGFPAKLDAQGLKYEKNANGRQIMIAGPEGLKLELTADPKVSATVFHHIHFYTADPIAIQAWYFEKFGARKGKRASWEAGDVPGANLTYTKATEAVAPTVTRVLDHIGFEVHDLEAFCKKLEASGVKFETPYRKIPQLGIALAFLVDPWGTRIELTEGLNKI